MAASGRPTSIDPAAVPHRRLASGALMPAVGLGTFGSDHVSPAQVAEAVLGAAAFGYRHFDCASVYGNERRSRRRLPAGPRLRHPPLAALDHLQALERQARRDDVLASCRQSLADLGLDYLDLYLVHWPFPNFHPPGCDVTSRSPDARPYIHENYMRTWRKPWRSWSISASSATSAPPT